MGLRRFLPLLALAAACSSGPAPVSSEWPPPDFELVVEELRSVREGGAVRRRFSVAADRLCLYAEAPETIGGPRAGLELPVFSKLCVYRLLQVNTRLLARKLYKRGILELSPVQGETKSVDAPAIRLYYRAFNEERLVVASGQIHGSMVRLLHVVNAYLPPGDEYRFWLPGMVGDPEPTNLSGVPAPVAGAPEALVAHLELLDLRPDDPDLLLQAYALACWEQDRALALRLLRRWAEVSGVGATPQAPFSDPPPITRDMLEALLPS